MHMKPRATDACTSKTSACGTSLSLRRQADPPPESVKVLPGSPDFSIYAFNAVLPTSQGISSFSVEISEGGKSTMETNGGPGFPLHDLVVPQRSCFSQSRLDASKPELVNSSIHISAAVSSDLRRVAFRVYVPRLG